MVVLALVLVGVVTDARPMYAIFLDGLIGVTA